MCKSILLVLGLSALLLPPTIEATDFGSPKGDIICRVEELDDSIAISFGSRMEEFGAPLLTLERDRAYPLVELDWSPSGEYVLLVLTRRKTFTMQILPTKGGVKDVKGLDIVNVLERAQGNAIKAGLLAAANDRELDASRVVSCQWQGPASLVVVVERLFVAGGTKRYPSLRFKVACQRKEGQWRLAAHYMGEVK